jgi:hypothetical protein
MPSPTESPFNSREEITEARKPLRRIGTRERLMAIFASDELFWRKFAYFVGVIAFLKGVRLPSVWSATQAQFDYSSGFIKRGLFGELMDLLRIHQYSQFVVFSCVVLGVFVFLLWRYCGAIGNGAKESVVAAVFLSSLAFTYLAHLVGYLDIFLALLVLATLMISSRIIRAIAAIPIVICGVLIHEGFLFIYLPLLLFDYFIGSIVMNGVDRSVAVRNRWYATILIGTAFGTALGAASVPSLSPAKLTIYSQQIAQKVDFPIRPDCVQILGRSIRDNLLNIKEQVALPYWWHNQIDSFCEFAPTLLFLLLIGYRLIDRTFTDGSNVKLKAAITVVSLLPLAMNLFGMDVYRWSALSVLNAFIALAITKRHFLKSSSAFPQTGVSTLLRNVAILLIAINLSSGSGLMDGYRTRTFPFLDLRKPWIESVFHHRLTVPDR